MYFDPRRKKESGVSEAGRVIFLLLGVALIVALVLATAADPGWIGTAIQAGVK